eukprot:scaffold30174_cov24-Tisochrysis_lutea.AAC.1
MPGSTANDCFMGLRVFQGRVSAPWAWCVRASWPCQWSGCAGQHRRKHAAHVCITVHDNAICPRLASDVSNKARSIDGCKTPTPPCRLLPPLRSRPQQPEAAAGRALWAVPHRDLRQLHPVIKVG